METGRSGAVTQVSVKRSLFKPRGSLVASISGPDLEGVRKQSALILGHKRPTCQKREKGQSPRELAGSGSFSNGRPQRTLQRFLYESAISCQRRKSQLQISLRRENYSKWPIQGWSAAN